MKISKQEKEEKENNNNRNNRQGLLGWLNPFGYGWERASYWLQRLTGLFLLVYFMGHVFEVNSLTEGKDAWNAMLEFTITQTPFGHIFLILVVGTVLSISQMASDGYLHKLVS